MISTYSQAIEVVEDFSNKINEMDRAFCRRGGHPDEAWWVTDKVLLEKLIRVQKAVLGLRNDLLEKKLKEEDEERSN